MDTLDMLQQYKRGSTLNRMSCANLHHLTEWRHFNGPGMDLGVVEYI